MHALFAEPAAFNVAFDEAIAFQRQKISLPTATWRDIEGRSHDRAFVVAGATKEALLADLKAEIDKAVEGRTTLADFRKSFDDIVGRRGWTGWTGEGSAAGRAWRTRTIFETNLTTAYAAGRHAQMTDPDIVKVHKWWRYRHGFYRTPERARPKHLMWDGIVLAWNDPWWIKHTPPNDWLCSCGVESLTDRELKAEGIAPDAAPTETMRSLVDPKTGETVEVPTGVGFGWDHTPGRDWAAGLVPRELLQPLRPASSGAAAPPTGLTRLVEIAKPFTSGLMDADLPAQDYVDAFLAEFGARAGAAKAWRDASGHVVAISDALFRDGQGRLKIRKLDRSVHVLRLAEALRDPDEIWIDWAVGPSGAPTLVRRYLRASPDGPEYAAFAWSRDGWEGRTAFNPQKGKNLKPDPDYLERQRTGALLWRRGN